ncbi:hypothetical protein [Candidatus Protochlamydia sp. W-9]|uniref:hypothetical protein n=1 Tax=Candidatus Protochlamydia sp. W-9 TaxID=1785087 RepID=UPI00096AC56D|nr:hypothetical protein [Candidatus Protochlamydia sp. W-9]
MSIPANLSIVPTGNGTRLLENSEIHTEAQQTSDVQVPYVLRIPLNLAKGGVAGFLAYGMERILVWIKFVEYSQPVTCFPYVLSGIASAAIIESAYLTHLVALKLIGERSIYENLPERKSNLVDKLRKGSWSVVRFGEDIEKKVDAVFSYTLKIRTKQQILDCHIKDNDLVFLEIFRRVLIEQVKESFVTSIPQELGIGLVKKCGYIFVGGELILSMHILQFINGLVDKFTAVHNKIRAEEEELAKQASQTNGQSDSTKEQAIVANIQHIELEQAV